ncbi:MAG: glutamate racemase [Patescibacteria group bacterium]
MTDNRPIGVFDSGVGGLSILIELKKLLPKENFVFFADQKNVPYGEKGKKELVGFMYKVVDYLIAEQDIKMFVIACNTATCYTIKELRAGYKLPIVGTEPAIKPAAKRTRSGIIAVISTPATSKSKTVGRLIREFAKDVDVINIGCKNLENTVEKGSIDNPEVKKLLAKYLNGVKNSNADCLVLGCTHYPFLKSTIGKMLGPKIKLIDSGLAIARRTRFLLKKKANGKGSAIYFTTGDSRKFEKVASKLLKRKVVAKKVIL